MGKATNASGGANTGQQWPADKVERRAVVDLIPYARNARTHSEAQVAQLAASIREWGWTTPLLIDEGGNIIAGHGRVLAAHKLKLETIPVMVAKGWTTAQKQAYIIADNKLALNADWDTDLLKIELSELQELDFNVELLGFTGGELDLVMNGWLTTIDPTEKDGTNLDGIETAIKVRVEQDAADRAKEVIKESLGSAGISFEFA